jgi:hypothetical protein
VRIVAACALSIAFPVAGGSSKRFYDECCFPEAAILVKRTAAEFGIRADGRRQYKRTCIGGIVQFVMVARHTTSCRILLIYNFVIEQAWAGAEFGDSLYFH